MLNRVILRCRYHIAIGCAALALNAGAQLSKVGIIDFYGLRTVKKEALIAVLGIKSGDLEPVAFPAAVPEDELRKAFGIPQGSALPGNVRQLESRLTNIQGVAKAKLATVCCEADGTATLFVGVSEKGAPQFDYRPEPTGPINLPTNIVTLYDRHLEALFKAVRSGNAQEDDSDGHALFKGEAFEPIQAELIRSANEHLNLLMEVLANSADAKQRAVAAWVLAYVKDKKVAAEKLLDAVRDPSELVRNNATRALGPIIALTNRRPGLEIEIRPEIFVEMLHSLSWSDRNKATLVLQKLTEGKRPDVLKLLHQRALTELTEMARWKAIHSQMAVQLLGRIAGMSDRESKELWETGKRELVIERAISASF